MSEIMTMEMMNDAKHITSIEIAQLMGKAHNHVMRDIRNMEPAWEEVHQSKFGQMQIQEKLPNGGYRMRPCYLLTKSESLFVATKYNDVARAKLVIRWAQLESEYFKAKKTHMAMLETEAEIKNRCDEIRKKEIYMANESATGCFTMTQAARKLRMSYRELCLILEENNIIRSVNGVYELMPPYTLLGYECYRHHEGYKLDGNLCQNNYMVWTPEGLVFLKNKVKQIKKLKN